MIDLSTDIRQKLERYRLSPDEYQRILNSLGREPQGVEWALFSALWSEHCSYKSSKRHLKKFAFRSPRVLQSFGENAGVIDLGEGEKIAFKMESHNHPSFIEPFQGAATGVGGILRDIFTMGARPIALANYLCFGEPNDPRMNELVDGVVRGISSYGNCVGVPNVTGQTEFHSSYSKNILVNAFALGLFTQGDQIMSNRAHGVGNAVVYVGAKTGRDGVHGASMASESFDDQSASKRPTIQIGDPFYEKLLIEGCLEVFKSNCVIAIQDMGAAGLTSSSFEMASRGQVGMRLHLDRVPLRDSSLSPEDILLSESQERMLLVCEPKNIPTIQTIFAKYGLDAVAIGELTKGPQVELMWRGETLTNINPKDLVDEAPQYDRPYQERKVGERSIPLSQNRKPLPKDSSERLLGLLRDVRGCSRRWIFDQYDQRVGAQTARDCQSPVGVLRLPSDRALGIVLGTRPHVMRSQPRLGAQDAVAYAALELSVMGFEPLAITDCLNFASPEKPHIMGDFVASVEGLAEAAQVFDAPVISGNVSFYNETNGAPITPTPAIGVVGLRPKIHSLPQSHFTADSETIFWVRCPQVKFSGLASEIWDLPVYTEGKLNLTELSRWMKTLRNLSAKAGSVRVVGKFGLAYALARMATDHLGCKVTAQVQEKFGVQFFEEELYSVLMVGGLDLAAALNAQKIDFVELGHVQAHDFEIDEIGVKLNVQHIGSAYAAGFGDHFARLS